MLKGLRYSALSPMLVSMLIFLAGPVWAQPAPDANSVIVLASIDPAQLLCRTADLHGIHRRLRDRPAVGCSNDSGLRHVQSDRDP